MKSHKRLCGIQNYLYIDDGYVDEEDEVIDEEDEGDDSNYVVVDADDVGIKLLAATKIYLIILTHIIVYKRTLYIIVYKRTMLVLLYVITEYGFMFVHNIVEDMVDKWGDGVKNSRKLVDVNCERSLTMGNCKLNLGS